MSPLLLLKTRCPLHPKNRLEQQAISLSWFGICSTDSLQPHQEKTYQIASSSKLFKKTIAAENQDRELYLLEIVHNYG